MSDNYSTDVLARKIAEGTANREERGITLKTINTQLAIEMVTGLEDVRDYVDGLKDLRSKFTQKFVEKANEALELDELDLDDVFKYMNSIADNEVKVVEAYRKLLQGGQLFSEDSMSEQDRIIVRLLQSFKDSNQKKEFYEMVAKYMALKNISLD